MSNPGLDPGRMKLESAYTEAEAAQEVIDSALACLEGRCADAPDFDEDDDEPSSGHGCADIYRALKTYQQYKGVK